MIVPGIMASVPFGRLAPSTAYYDHIMAASPVLYLRCNETSGSAVLDSSPWGHHFSYLGGNTSSIAAPGLLVSVQDGSFLMPGGSATTATNFLRSNSLAFGAGVFSFTFGAVLTPQMPAAGGVGIVMQASGWGEGAFEIGVEDQGAGGFKVRINRSGTSTLILSATTYSYGSLIHVVARHNGFRTELYVNGVLDGVRENAQFVGNENRLWTVGAGQFGTNLGSQLWYRYSGGLDEVFFITGAPAYGSVPAYVSPAWIADLYSKR